MFQRQVYHGALRTLTEYRRHLDGCSPDTVDEYRHRPVWFSLRDCGSRCLRLGPRYRKCSPFHTLAAVDARGIFASQIRWRIRRRVTETGDSDMRFGLVKFSHEVFGLSARAVAVGPRLKFGAAEWEWWN